MVWKKKDIRFCWFVEKLVPVYCEIDKIKNGLNPKLILNENKKEITCFKTLLKNINNQWIVFDALTSMPPQSSQFLPGSLISTDLEIRYLTQYQALSQYLLDLESSTPPILEIITCFAVLNNILCQTNLSQTLVFQEKNFLELCSVNSLRVLYLGSRSNIFFQNCLEKILLRRQICL